MLEQHSINPPSRLLVVCGFALRHDSKWHGIEQHKFPNPQSIERSIERQIELGCRLVREDRYDVVAFSGGRTRPELYLQGITSSESEGMLAYAKSQRWTDGIEILDEPWARDSFENIFFAMLAFFATYKQWPAEVGAISMPHKSMRFMLSAAGLKLPQFQFHGAGSADPVEQNCIHELKNLGEILDVASGTLNDPLLRAKPFVEKRSQRAILPTDSYVHELKAAYTHDSTICELIDQVETCSSTRAGWQKLVWPWMRRRNWYYDIGRLSDHCRGDGDDFILMEADEFFGNEFELKRHIAECKRQFAKFYDQPTDADPEYPYFCPDQGRFALSESWREIPEK